MVWSSGRPYPNAVDPPNRKTFIACGCGGHSAWSLDTRKPAGSTFTNFPWNRRSLNSVNGSYSNPLFLHVSVIRVLTFSSRQPGYAFRTLSFPYHSMGVDNITGRFINMIG